MIHPQNSAPIASWRGEFACSATEADFLGKHASVIQRDLTRSLLFCSLFYVTFALTDIADLGYGSRTVTLFVARLLVALVALAGIALTHHSKDPLRSAQRAATAATSFGMATFLLIVYCRPNDVLLHGMSMAIMLIIVYLFIPNRLLNATVVAVAASVSFLALACTLGTVGPGRLLSMGLLLILANLFGAAAARRGARLWREQYWAQEILTNLSVRDPLTGTFNRRHLNAGLLDGEIARARRYSLSLTLILCDLDAFKHINDTYGHQAGDVLLQDFAALLQSMTRDGIDTVVRYGGEEFLLILPETRLPGGADLAERIRSAFAAHRSRFGDAELATTASFGVVSAHLTPESAGPNAQALIAQADELMYAAKRGGRNRVTTSQWHAVAA